MKGTPSQGKRSRHKTHIYCRRCGNHSYHASKNVCAQCGYGVSAKLRFYNWKKPGK
ncbi:MAG TPA: 50S ribosomal protein L37e [Candidatus Nanoarchaeia archaeon]|nr:50S ribosomal protein L37e [Candidatus Nanoarchaeia archaeon]